MTLTSKKILSTLERIKSSIDTYFQDVHHFQTCKEIRDAADALSKQLVGIKISAQNSPKKRKHQENEDIAKCERYGAAWLLLHNVIDLTNNIDKNGVSQDTFECIVAALCTILSCNTWNDMPWIHYWNVEEHCFPQKQSMWTGGGNVGQNLFMTMWRTPVPLGPRLVILLRFGPLNLPGNLDNTGNACGRYESLDSRYESTHSAAVNHRRACGNYFASEDAVARINALSIDRPNSRYFQHEYRVSPPGNITPAVIDRLGMETQSLASVFTNAMLPASNNKNMKEGHGILTLENRKRLALVLDDIFTRGNEASIFQNDYDSPDRRSTIDRAITEQPFEREAREETDGKMWLGDYVASLFVEPCKLVHSWD